MAKESFLRGAMILALASSISRIVGILYMVLLPRIIRDDGMGLFQLVKPIYYFAAVIAISGMPVAVSKLVAEKAARGSVKGVLRVLRVALLVMLVTGSISTLFMWFSADIFTEKIAKDPGVYYTVLVLAPAVFFLAIGGALRGFFQGLQHMTPTAVAQIVDQLCRVVVTITLAAMLMPRGVEYGVAGAAFGSVAGEFISVLTLLSFYLWQKKSLLNQVSRYKQDDQERWSSIIKRMIMLAFPVVVATILWPVMQMLDTLLIPTRMQAAGFSPEEIRDWLGYLGMALTISQFPNVVTVALATSLIPAISEASALGSNRLIARRSEEAMRIAILFGLPSFIGLLVLAEPISAMLFNYPLVGIPLKVLAIGTVTLGLIQATTGILQGLGLVMIPVRNLLVGVLVKLVLNYYLTGLPHFGVMGAAWGTTLGWLTVAILNFGSVTKRVGLVLHFPNMVVKPVIVSGIMGLLVYYIHDTSSYFLKQNTISTLASIIFGMLFYFLFLMWIGVITRKDVQLVPKFGSGLAASLYDWGFLRK